MILDIIYSEVRPYLMPAAISLILFLKRTTLARITAEIKHTYSSKMEELKHQHSQKQFVHKLQFETEFNAYKELWAKVCEWRKVFRRYQTEALSIDESLDGGFEKKRGIYHSTYESFQKLFDDMVIMKPFLYGEVHTEIESILRDYDKELQEYLGHKRHGMKPGWYDERTSILRRLDERFYNNLSEKIKARIGILEPIAQTIVN
jgi:hypothetical protein